MNSRERFMQWVSDCKDEAQWFIEDNGEQILGIIAIVILICTLFGVLVSKAHAQVISPAYSDEQIVNAIYHAEGGAKAVYAYGIRSVHYKDIAEARRICFNTVRNNRKRFAKQTKYQDYLSFLDSRYCPIGCDNDRGTNKFWLKNVKYFLKRGC